MEENVIDEMPFGITEDEVESQEVIEELKYYVYKLIDPRNGNVFYVGKGIYNR